MDLSTSQYNMVGSSPSLDNSHIHDISPAILRSLPSRELENARIRVMEMEKSLKWWTDCSTNWREKWTKAHSQRNKSRDECKMLYMKIEKLKNKINNTSQDTITDSTDIPEKLGELEISREELPCDISTCDIDTLKTKLAAALKRIESLEINNKECNERILFLNDNIKNLHKTHSEEIKKISKEIAMESDESIEQKATISKLRSQVEKLQAENICEWNRADQTDCLLRESQINCNKLTTQVESLSEDLDNARNAKHQTSSINELADAEIYRLHKELNDHRLLTSKLSKQLQDYRNNIEHLTTRADSYDFDTRNLRCRVEKLKSELANQQDLFGQEVTSLKKCKRDKDDLEQLNDCLQIECDQLKSRLRMRSKSKSPFRNITKDSRSSSLQSFEANEVSIIEDNEV